MGCIISLQTQVNHPEVNRIKSEQVIINIQHNNNPEDNREQVERAQQEHHQQQQPSPSQAHTNYTYESRVNDRNSQYNPNSHISPFNCIGVIYYGAQSGKQVFGLGFLISPRIVITALHVLKKFVRNGKKKLYFIIKDENDDQQMTMMSIIARNNFSFLVASIKNNEINQEQIHPSQDYCLLYLQKSVNRKSYIVLAHTYRQHQSQKTNEEAIIPNILYSTNRIRQTIDRGPIVSVKKNEICYDINTVSGQSGGPILVQLSNQIWVAIGLHTGHEEGKGYNSGCLFTQKIIEQFDDWSQQLQSYYKINKVKIPYDINKSQLNRIINEISFSPEAKIAYTMYRLQSSHTQFKNYVYQMLNSSKAEAIYRAANILYNLYLNHLSILLCEHLINVKKVSSSKLTNLLAMNYASTHQVQYAVWLLLKSLPQSQQKKNDSAYIQTLNTLGTLLYSTNKKLALKFFYESAKICSQTSNYSGVNIAISNIGIIKIQHRQRQGNQLLLIENVANNIKKLAQDDKISNQRTIIELYRTLADLYKKIGRRDYEEIDCSFQQLIMQKNMWLKLHIFLTEGQSRPKNLSQRFPLFKKKQQQFCHLIRKKLLVNDLSFVITVIYMLDELLKGNNSHEIIEFRKNIIKKFKKTIESCPSWVESLVI